VGERICEVKGCGRPHKAKGYCLTHYRRYKRRKDLNIPIDSKYSWDQRKFSKLCEYCGSLMENVGIKRQYCDSCQGHQGWRQTKHRYGVTLPQWKQLFGSQNGVCAICGNHETERQHLSVDHDHSCCPGDKSCGKCVRGLLCNACNNGIGRLREDPKILRRAAEYVEEARCRLDQTGIVISWESPWPYPSEQTALGDKLGLS
jgi:Recombination endonuclease VII